ncbi:MAG: hypothetical protein ACTHKX_01000 [Pseudolysinimonas sp.]
MSLSEQFAAVNDQAARRVLSGSEPAYPVTVDAADANFELAPGSDFWLAWTRISDLYEYTPALTELEGERLCGQTATEFSQRWLAVADRTSDVAQERFFEQWTDRWEEIAKKAWP